MSNSKDTRQKNPNVPNLRFSGYTNEWQTKRIDTLFEFVPNNSISRDGLNYDGGVWKNIHYGDILTVFPTVLDIRDGHVPYISSPTFSSQSSLSTGDVVIADTAEDYTAGKALEVVISEGIKVVPGLHTIACHPKVSFAPGFLGYYLNSSAYKERLRPLIQGIKVYSISKSSLATTSISFPSYDEQYKIGLFLSIIDRRISVQNKIIDDKKREIKALNDLLYRQTIKKHFRFADISRCYAGLFGKSADDFGEGMPYITYLNVLNNRYIDPSQRGYVSVKDGESQNSLLYGDVVLTLSSETPQEVGVASVYLESGIAYLNSFCTILRFDDENVICSEYATWLFSTTAFRKHIYPFAQGSTRYNLNLGSFMQSQFAIPRIDSQKKIGHMLNGLAQMVRIEERELSRLYQIKKFLLNGLFI